MRLDATAHGVYPIAPTPFHADGRIGEASIDRLCEAYIACGANGVTVLGIMG
jgi:4-hydroxy-tetrahydrodipicolinate synthase